MKEFGHKATMVDVIRERPTDIEENDNLRKNKLDGRIRTLNQAAPSSATDVDATDAEGDVITDATYVYTLYSISGTLKWDRRAHSAGW